MPKKKIVREIPEKPGKPTFLIIAIQLLLIVFFAIELFQVIEVNFEERTLTLSKDIMPYAFMFLIVFTLYSIHLVSKKKGTKAFELTSDAQFIIKETAKIKLKRSKGNPFTIALLMIEIAYVMLIALAIYFYLDPAQEIAWWTKLGLELQPPITTILNLLVFAVITAVFIFMHHYAAQFNAVKFQGIKGFKKTREKKKENA